MRDDFPTEITHQHTLEHIADGTFELIEDQTIDIDSIEELGTYPHADTYDWEDVENNIKTTNILIQVVKHLNKEIQSIKEDSNCFNMEISEKDINEAIKNARRQIKEEGI